MGTLTISVPAPWVKKHKLAKGDLIYLNEQKDGSLNLSMIEPKQELLKNSLSSKDLVPFLRKLVAAYYKAGYDELYIHYATSVEVDRVQSLLEFTCLGYEIMNLTPKTIEIRSVAKIKNEEFEEMQRKIFHLLLSTAQELYSAVLNYAPEKINSTLLRHKLVNRYADYCRRIINKFPEQFSRAGPLYSIIENLEKISDQYKAFSESILFINKKPSKEIIELLKQTIAYFEEIKTIFYKYESANMQTFVEAKKELDAKFTPKSIASSELMLWLNCKTILQITYDLNGPITTFRV